MKPVNWDAVTALSTLATAIAATLGLFFAAWQIHEFREESKIQHLMERVNEFDGERIITIRRSLAQKRTDNHQQRLQPLNADDPPDEMQDELNFCDDLGLLANRGALNVHDVWSEFSYWLFPLYADSRPAIDAARKGSPATYGNCSWLMDQIRPIEAKEDASADDHPSESDIYSFYLGEVGAEPGERLPKGKKHATQ